MTKSGNVSKNVSILSGKLEGWIVKTSPIIKEIINNDIYELKNAYECISI